MTFTTGFGDYDRWKLRGPDDDAEVCERCGGYLDRDWQRCGCFCDICDEEDERLQRQLDEQGDEPWISTTA